MRRDRADNPALIDAGVDGLTLQALAKEWIR